MRRGLTLIEMILTMVIVALVFMVVPKIIFVTNKSFETTMKEDALFNALSLGYMVASLPWDENNTKSDAILATSSPVGEYVCSASSGFYRVGGFKGARNCIDGGGTLAASPIGREDALFNDIDDYDAFTLNTVTSKGAKYLMSVDISYLQEPPSSNSLDLSSLTQASGSANIKEIKISITNAATNRKSPFKTTLYYHSANLGHIYINKRAWR